MKKYSEPEIEIEYFESEEIITVSYDENFGSFPSGWR